MADWTAAAIPDLSGRRAIVTGATTGIGFETARALARAGAEVVLTGRDGGRGARALARIRAERPDCRISFALADHAELASLARFAAGVVEQGAPLDILVNNAAVMALPRRELTRDGFEMQFGVNYLAYFALTAQLVPALLRAAAPRVVTVASLAHRRARLDFGNLQSERRYGRGNAYAQSKLADLMFALALARRCEEAGSPISSIAAHPGYARTALFDDTWATWVFIRLTSPVSQSAAAGALPLLYAATAPEAGNGGYYGPDRLGEMMGHPAPARIASHARDDATAERLWAESERLTRLRFPPLA